MFLYKISFQKIRTNSKFKNKDEHNHGDQIFLERLIFNSSMSCYKRVNKIGEFAILVKFHGFMDWGVFVGLFSGLTLSSALAYTLFLQFLPADYRKVYVAENMLHLEIFFYSYQNTKYFQLIIKFIQND